jgi:hypothetical protein
VTVGRLTMGWVSSYLRKATVEIDRVPQSESPLNNGGAVTWRTVGDGIGWDITVDELMAVGARRLNLFRAFNVREGLDRRADKLPKKFLKALKGEGPTAGVALTVVLFGILWFTA